MSTAHIIADPEHYDPRIEGKEAHLFDARGNMLLDVIAADMRSGFVVQRKTGRFGYRDVMTYYPAPLKLILVSIVERVEWLAQVPNQPLFLYSTMHGI